MRDVTPILLLDIRRVGLAFVPLTNTELRKLFGALVPGELLAGSREVITIALLPESRSAGVEFDVAGGEPIIIVFAGVFVPGSKLVTITLLLAINLLIFTT